MLCVLIRIAFWSGGMITPQWLKLPIYLKQISKVPKRFELLKVHCISAYHFLRCLQNMLAANSRINLHNCTVYSVHLLFARVSSSVRGGWKLWWPPRWLSWMCILPVIRRSWVRPQPGWQHSFMEIDQEIFSTVTLALPLIQVGQLSVSGERIWTMLVNCLEG